MGTTSVSAVILLGPFIVSSVVFPQILLGENWSWAVDSLGVRIIGGAGQSADIRSAREPTQTRGVENTRGRDAQPSSQGGSCFSDTERGYNRGRHSEPRSPYYTVRKNSETGKV